MAWLSWMSWEGWSDFLGFLSGIFLVITAWRNDSLLAFADRIGKSMNQAKAAGLFDPIGDELVARLKETPPDKVLWDRVWLRSGVFALLLSYGCKLMPSVIKWVEALINRSLPT